MEQMNSVVQMIWRVLYLRNWCLEGSWIGRYEALETDESGSYVSVSLVTCTTKGTDI